MKEIFGNIWDYHQQGYIIVVNTNGSVRKDGKAVMGRGLALQAAERFPDLPDLLGKSIRNFGNLCFWFPQYNIFTLPVKSHWNNNADLRTIENRLQWLVGMYKSFKPIFLTRPGCGSGRLSWDVVKPICEKVLADDRFVIVEHREKESDQNEVSFARIR